MATRETFLTVTLTQSQANKLVLAQNTFYQNIIANYNRSAFISTMSTYSSIYSVISELPNTTAAGIFSLALAMWEELAAEDENTFRNKANEGYRSLSSITVAASEMGAEAIEFTMPMIEYDGIRFVFGTCDARIKVNGSWIS